LLRFPKSISDSVSGVVNAFDLFPKSTAYLVTHITASWSAGGYSLGVFSGHITQRVLRGLDRIASSTSTAKEGPAHLRTGRRGEEDAYFYLRRKGYVMVARNFRTHVIAVKLI
jgi:hypothetical protein